MCELITPAGLQPTHFHFNFVFKFSEKFGVKNFAAICFEI